MPAEPARGRIVRAKQQIASSGYLESFGAPRTMGIPNKTPQVDRSRYCVQSKSVYPLLRTTEIPVSVWEWGDDGYWHYWDLLEVPDWSKLKIAP